MSIQVTPGNSPQPVVQAAIAAMNVHLRRHGRELIELSLSPQGAVDSTGRPSIGAQAQAEIHITASFSITAATSVAAGPHSDDLDPGSVRVTDPSSRVDLTWSPVSIGVLFHLDADERPRQPNSPMDYGAAEAEGRYINWVVNQLNSSDFASPGAGQLEVYEFVRQLLEVMRGASGEAQWTIHLGAMLPNEIPTGLTRGLTRAAQIIAGSSPQFSGLRRIRVSLLNLGPTRNGAEQLVRWTLLNVESQAVTPAPAPSGS